jgi:transcriptional regulator with PAS, ATPase and Fis domain
MKISKAAQKVLSTYRWPGNIRELRNVLERAVLLAEADELLPNHLLGLAKIIKKTDSGDDSLKLDVVESRHIEKVLVQCANDTQIAAEKLGISRASLYRKIEKYGLKK